MYEDVSGDGTLSLKTNISEFTFSNPFTIDPNCVADFTLFDVKPRIREPYLGISQLPDA